MAKKTLRKRAADSWRGASLTSRILVVTAVVAGTTGSITGIAASYPIVEPYFYVSRGELRLIVDKQALATDRQTLFQLQYNLDQVKRDPGAATSPEVQRRIRELEGQAKDTKSRICKATGTEECRNGP